MIFFGIGFIAPAVIYLAILVVHLLLPTRRIEGYVNNLVSGRPYHYHLNGIWVLLLLLVTWFLLGWVGWLPWDWLYQHRWGALSGACALGLIYTLICVLSAPATGRPVFVDLFLGRAQNVQYLHGRVDAKMFLYLAGAVMLVLNALSFAAHHQIVFGAAANPGVWLQAALLLFFVVDYLTFERVHLYTYDLFAERVGFKLGWGCLVFYPYFYPIGLWGTVNLASPGLIGEFGWVWLLFSALVFFSGWIIARGANMQKYYFKRFPERVFLGVIPPKVIEGGNQRLLCSGFWGVSRHINYLGEVIMATGIALSLGHVANPWPWLYPLYYIVLLVPRERDDDARCREKYGPLWEEYRRRVPSRIVPKLY